MSKHMKCKLLQRQYIFTIIHDAKLIHSNYSHPRVRIEVAAETVSLEGQCTTGVFFLGEAKDVGSKSNLRLALLLAVAKVVICEDGDHNA